MYACQQLDASGVCSVWVDLAAVGMDWASVGLTPGALAEAFFWGVGAVSAFAVGGWMIQLVRRVIREVFKGE